MINYNSVINDDGKLSGFDVHLQNGQALITKYSSVRGDYKAVTYSCEIDYLLDLITDELLADLIISSVAIKTWSGQINA